MSDLDAMHYERTGKNHQGTVTNDADDNSSKPIGVGDEELWEELK